jgi:aryl-alcohol dehydrogenase-like predicted oxidoreductase
MEALMGTASWYRSLGRSGLRLSPIGLGKMSFADPALQSWALDERRATPIVREAIDRGITFFDTADMYSDGESERITGALLRRAFASREEYVLAAKVYYPTGRGANDRGLSRKHLVAAIDGSLRRLGVDYVDLYQIHRWDEDTPIEETMAALHDIVRSGKARYIGASTMRAWQFAKAQHAAGPGPGPNRATATASRTAGRTSRVAGGRSSRRPTGRGCPGRRRTAPRSPPRAGACTPAVRRR